MGKYTVSVHDRGEGQSSLVYPVVSRRSGGLSVGINLFPDGKRCSFDCPYCEVRPFTGGVIFSPETLEAELEAFLAADYGAAWAPRPVHDLCVSGNGEPTLSPHLWEALEICAAARRRHPAILAPGACPIVIITNSTGFMDEEIARRLAEFARREPLDIWAKLDAGSQERFAHMSRSSYNLDDISDAIGDFARSTPITIQTMVCDMDGAASGAAAASTAVGATHKATGADDDAEALSYAARVNAMLEKGAAIKAIQVYTLARAPLEAGIRALSDEAVTRFVRLVSGALSRPLPIYGYGERGSGPLRQR
ncbi:MAG TPA: radical SAM protein [Rectinemataceae bacterium]|nr:radical SAM protein [Rectinemataceae bacterium]